MRGMFFAHKRGERIPAKSAQTAPSHCDHHMFTNSRVPTPRWKREEMPHEPPFEPFDSGPEQGFVVCTVFFWIKRYKRYR